MVLGNEVYRADGSAFFSGGGGSYHIDKGVLTDLVNQHGVRLVSMFDGRYMVPFDGRWRATRAEALCDARDKLAEHAERMRGLAAEADIAAKEVAE